MEVLQTPKGKYTTVGKLGRDLFGYVRVLQDVTGARLALRTIPWFDESEAHRNAFQKRKIEELISLSHPSIAKYREVLGSEGRNSDILDEQGRPCVKLLMEFGKDPWRYYIYSLMNANGFDGKKDQIRLLLLDCLRGLDYLESKEVTHGGITPVNITLTLCHGRYTYQIVDLGNMDPVGPGESFLGPGRYDAPERHKLRTGKRRYKEHIWSLFVIIAEAYDREFRETLRTRPTRDIIEHVQRVSELAKFEPLRPMACLNPDERVSAGDMLDMMFGGEGRSTPGTLENRGHIDWPI
ncbi:kinase-like domain-containing protein [Ilyonectria destructans]|nr:kinase-like domain-containing protein [Ilyonectria destructans]